MNKNSIVIIYILFFMLYSCNLVSAIEDYKCNNEYFTNISPTFSLIFRTDKPIIDQGDVIELKLYINGFGASPNFTKISVYLPIRFAADKNEYGTIDTVSENNTINTRKLDNITERYDFQIPIPNYYFNYTLTKDICYIRAEGNRPYYPPVTIKLNTSKDVAPGDHNIDLILSYSDGEKSYQNTQVAKIHINSWSEQKSWILINETWIFIFLTIFFGIVSIIGIGGELRRLSKKWIYIILLIFFIGLSLLFETLIFIIPTILVILYFIIDTDKLRILIKKLYNKIY